MNCNQWAKARWGGSESGTVNYPCWSTFPYHSTGAGESAQQEIAKNKFKLLKEGDTNGKYWMPVMADAPLRGYNGRHEWFWESADEGSIFPLENLMDIYYKSVGRNSTLIMGLTPDPDGLLPESDVKRLKEWWGDEIKRQFSNPAATTSGKGKTIELKLDKRRKIDQIIIQEDIVYGERIRKYTVEALVNGKWRAICEGESVGHKRIQQFETIECNRIRLVVNEAIDEPIVKNFAIYLKLHLI